MQQEITREVAGRLLAAQVREGASTEPANRQLGCFLCALRGRPDLETQQVGVSHIIHLGFYAR